MRIEEGSYAKVFDKVSKSDKALSLCRATRKRFVEQGRKCDICNVVQQAAQNIVVVIMIRKTNTSVQCPGCDVLIEWGSKKRGQVNLSLLAN
jgi:hypothetical protein